MAKKLDNGKWILNRGEPQWLAWREWWLGPFQRKFWPEKSERVTMLTEWPPETHEAADMVASWWAGVKDVGGKNAGKDLPWDAPKNPQPWKRWTWEAERRKITAFRDNESLAGGLGPNDVARIDEIMRQFKAKSPQKPPKLGAPLRIIANPEPPKRDYDLAARASAKVSE